MIAKKSVLAVYQEDIEKARAASQKLKLGKEFLNVAIATNDDYDAKYVLLGLANSIAVDQNDIDLGEASVLQMIKTFDVDDVDRLLKFYQSFKFDRIPRERRLKVLDRLRDLARECMIANRYENSLDFAKMGLEIAKSSRNIELISSVASQLDNIHAAQQESLEFEIAAKSLSSDPTNGKANLVVGAFKCFVLADWDSGLVNLTLCSDDRLKSLARSELGGVPNYLSLGDMWWEYAENVPGFKKLQIQSHAISCYQRVIKSLTGLTRARVEQRMAKIAPAAELTSGTLQVPEAINAGDPRMAWQNKSYDTVIKFVGNGRGTWHEIENDTGKVRNVWIERSRTPEYVYIYLDTQKRDCRMSSRKMEHLTENRWDWLAEGNWLHK